MADLTSLIERIEAATEGSRELDGLIECEVRRWQAYKAGLNDAQRSHWKPVGTKGEVIDEQGFTRYHPPTYSFSIDAALTLLPEGLEFEFTNLYGVAAVGMGINTESPCYARREDGNITLALLAAVLRARQTDNSHDES